MATVETERRDQIIIVKINRPEARNAVDAGTAGLLEAAVNEFKRDQGLRVMVLTGEGGPPFVPAPTLNQPGG